MLAQGGGQESRWKFTGHSPALPQHYGASGAPLKRGQGSEHASQAESSLLATCSEEGGGLDSKLLGSTVAREGPGVALAAAGLTPASYWQKREQQEGGSGSKAAGTRGITHPHFPALGMKPGTLPLLF